jgi:multisubunit Na+/H+ antiporter MnhG subunit
MREDVIKQLAALITAAFGLVAALAWNSAIQEIFRLIFGQQSGVWAMILYAIVVTVIAVVATIAIGRAAAKAGVKEERKDSSTKQDSEAA